jgi:hypothetical protein
VPSDADTKKNGSFFFAGKLKVFCVTDMSTAPHPRTHTSGCVAACCAAFQVCRTGSVAHHTQHTSTPTGVNPHKGDKQAQTRTHARTHARTHS